VRVIADRRQASDRGRDAQRDGDDALGITSVVAHGHEEGLGGTAINIASAMTTVAD
jgi:hypothetical protein